MGEKTAEMLHSYSGRFYFINTIINKVININSFISRLLIVIVNTQFGPQM